MQKIPTLFQRDEQRKGVINQVNPECQWVIDGLGVATRKLDGTCCLVSEGKLYKRHEVKAGAPTPIGFFPASEPDPHTGKIQGWVPVGDGPEDKYHREAWENKRESGADFPPDDGTYELLGPKVQGNPEQFPSHCLFAHDTAHLFPTCPRDFDGLKAFLADHDIEGVVWHHEDGRMSKIKQRDFGLKRLAKGT